MYLEAVCPKCRRKERIKLNSYIQRELDVLGYTTIAFYHTNHAFYVGLDRYGIKTIDIFDPPSSLIYASNIVVNQYFLVRKPVISLPLDVIFLDTKNMVVDARFVRDHMLAIIFTRYFAMHKRKSNAGTGIINALGQKFYYGTNDYITVAVLDNGSSENLEIVINRLLGEIHKVPVNPTSVLKTISQ